jgi:hypothetical protein
MNQILSSSAANSQGNFPWFPHFLSLGLVPPLCAFKYSDIPLLHHPTINLLVLFLKSLNSIYSILPVFVHMGPNNYKYLVDTSWTNKWIDRMWNYQAYIFLFLVLPSFSFSVTFNATVANDNQSLKTDK